MYVALTSTLQGWRNTYAINIHTLAIYFRVLFGCIYAQSSIATQNEFTNTPMTNKHISFLLAALLLLLAAPAAAKKKAKKSDITVAVFSLNDFHGAFVRDDEKDVPGAPAILQTIDSLRRVYPNSVTVSAGDNFGGSGFYNATHGQLLPPFFASLGIRLSAVGNHEFDDGQKALANKWNGLATRPAGWDITYVCANVRDASGAIPAFAQPFASVSVPVGKKDSVRIAFVGLIASSTPQQASASKLKGLSFDGNYPTVLDSVKRLPSFPATVGKADIRLLLTHIGTKTTSDGTPYWEDNDVPRLLAINDPTWHAILSAHSHEAVVGTINSRPYPVVQGKWHGEYISVVTFRLDAKTHAVKDIHTELCPVRPTQTPSAEARHLQEQIDSLLTNTKTSGGTPLGERITFCPQKLIHSRDDKMRQTLMGSFVTRAYAEAYRTAAHAADTAIVVGGSHFQSIRSGFPKGTISTLDVIEALPFSNALKTYRLTGEQLLNLVRFGRHNKRFGWLQTSWLRIDTDAQGEPTCLTYVSPQGSERPITASTPCIFVVDEFITTGGDGYTPTLFPADQQIEVLGLPTTTDAFINYLKTFSSLPLE